jgi:hypothetical protein
MKHSHSFAMTIFHKIVKSAKLVILPNASDVVVSSGIEHCSLGSQSMNMSVEQHMSGC